MTPTTWEWFGHAGHLIVGQDCRFHLCTLVGRYLVSTVGEYLPDSNVRETLAGCRGITLEGQGDARRADWMRKVGWEQVGCDRKYETMVFEVTKARCRTATCGCGMPEVKSWSEVDFHGCNNAGEAWRAHLRLCKKWARKRRGERSPHESLRVLHPRTPH